MHESSSLKEHAMAAVNVLSMAAPGASPSAQQANHAPHGAVQSVGATGEAAARIRKSAALLAGQQWAASAPGQWGVLVALSEQAELRPQVCLFSLQKEQPRELWNAHEQHGPHSYCSCVAPES